MADADPSELDQLRRENALLIGLLEAHGIAWRASAISVSASGLKQRQGVVAGLLDAMASAEVILQTAMHGQPSGRLAIQAGQRIATHHVGEAYS